MLVENRVIRGEGASGDYKNDGYGPRNGGEGKEGHALKRYFAGVPNTSTSM